MILPPEIFSKIQSELELSADPEFREKIRDYFKMDVSNYLGVRIERVVLHQFPFSANDRMVRLTDVTIIAFATDEIQFAVGCRNVFAVQNRR